MKALKNLFYILVIIFVLYIISIFAFPSVSSFIGEKLGITNFNENVLKLKDKFDKNVTSIDVMGELESTKKQALEVKQNVDNTIKDTQNKIDNVRENFDKTTNAINKTTQSVNETLNSLNDLQNSIKNVVPKTGTGTDSASGNTK